MLALINFGANLAKNQLNSANTIIFLIGLTTIACEPNLISGKQTFSKNSQQTTVNDLADDNKQANLLLANLKPPQLSENRIESTLAKEEVQIQEHKYLGDSKGSLYKNSTKSENLFHRDHDDFRGRKQDYDTPILGERSSRTSMAKIHSNSSPTLVGGQSNFKLPSERTSGGCGARDELDERFEKLARRLRNYMSLCGILEDVGLLLGGSCEERSMANSNSDSDSNASTNSNSNSNPNATTKNRKGRRRWLVNRLFLIALVVFANLMAFYVTTAHFIWEIKSIESKIASSLTNKLGSLAAVKGSSVIKEFLENSRRHLSRLSAFVSMLTWHFSCRKIELLFVDCQKYYSIFYKNPKQIWDLSQENRMELIASGEKFYQLASARANWSLRLPIIQFLFNITTLFLFQSSTKDRYKLSQGTSNSSSSSQLTFWQKGMKNFDSFHLSIHTAFHPLDHKIIRRNKQTAEALGAQPQLDSGEAQVSPTTSAIYCLAELLIYSFYVHGPRIVSAVCLSIVLNLHFSCIKSFNLSLMSLIKRAKGRAMSRRDLRNLIKQHDLICTMHERIETTFSWSIIQWYGLMFISCLMHIFSFTESTSAYVASSNTNYANKLLQRQRSQLNATIQQVGPSAAQSSASGSAGLNQAGGASQSQSSSAVSMFVRLASVFFVCYSPYLIYLEAYKIESASSMAEQLIMKLARRQDDPLAQSIEPSLFEPICLSVGGYFKLSKKSMSSFLGAIVTFSVMFIVSANKRSGEGLKKLVSAFGDPPGASDNNNQDNEEEDDDDDDETEEDEEEGGGDNQDSSNEEEHSPAFGQRAGDNELGESLRAKPNLDPSLHSDDSEAAEPDLEAPSEPRADPARPFGAQESGRSQEQGDAPSEGERRRARIQQAGQRRIGLAPPTHPQQRQVNSNRQLKARQRRKFKRLNKQHSLINSENQTSAGSPRPTEAPQLAERYFGRLRENERLVGLKPKLRILNQVEVCDIELVGVEGGRKSGDTNNGTAIPFFVSWLDRIQGEASLEARGEELMNCERQRNFTFKLRAIGCNGLKSNEGQVEIQLEDVNEFGPEFERKLYSVTLNIDSANNGPPLKLDSAEINPSKHEEVLVKLEARDRDCSPEFGTICRYEILQQPLAHQAAQAAQAIQVPAETEAAEQGNKAAASDLNQLLSIDSAGNLKLLNRESLSVLVARQDLIDKKTTSAFAQQQLTFQVIAYDCGGKKSQNPTTVQLNFNKLCQPSLKDVETQITYRPGSREKSPFLRSQLDLCGLKCSRPNISIAISLESQEDGADQRPETRADSWQLREQRNGPKQAKLGSFQCDRDSYSVVSKRRLCGSRRKSIELLPTGNTAQNKWIYPLYKSSISSLGSDDNFGRPLPAESNPSEAIQEEFLAQTNNRFENYHNHFQGQDDLNFYSLEGPYVRHALSSNEPISGEGAQSRSSSSSNHSTTRSAGGEAGFGSSGAGGSGQAASKSLAQKTFGPSGRKRASRGKHSGARRRGSHRQQSEDDNSPTKRRRVGRETATGDRLSQGSHLPRAPTSEARRRPAPDVFRDQVYRFDGRSTAALVPRSLLAEIEQKKSESVAHNSSGSEQSDSNSNLNLNPNPNPNLSGEPQTAESLLFGSKHTLTFWMRHAPVKAGRPNKAPSGDNMDQAPTAAPLRPSSSFTSGSGRRDSDEGANFAESAAQEREAGEAAAKLVKEHLLCASLEPQAVGADSETAGSGSTNSRAGENFTPMKLNNRSEEGPGVYLDKDASKQRRRSISDNFTGSDYFDAFAESGEHSPDSNGIQAQHYYSLFVRNCKLVLIMRRHYQHKTGSEDNNYKPSEWHWSFSSGPAASAPGSPAGAAEGDGKICDNKWHLYTINVLNGGSLVELYVDGEQFVENYENLAIVDDLPLKAGNPNHFAKHYHPPARRNSVDFSAAAEDQFADFELDFKPILTIGACYDFRKRTMFGHFNGLLAGMNILIGENDDSQLIECLGQCSESLVQSPIKQANGNGNVFHPMLHDQEQQIWLNKLDNSLVLYQEAPNRILMNGHDILDIEDALSQIAYVNHRHLPSIGKRLIRVHTQIECLPTGSELNNIQIKSPNMNNYFEHGTSVEIDVQASKFLPAILISGSPRVLRDFQPFFEGIKVFASISLRIKRIQITNSLLNSPHQQKLVKATTTSSQFSPSLRQQPSKSKLIVNDEDSDYIDDFAPDESASGGAEMSQQAREEKWFQQQQNSSATASAQVQSTSDLPSIRRRSIEACNVKLYPPLNGLYESLVLPEASLKKLSLYYQQSPEGFAIYGLDSVENYEKILHKIVYKNQRPAYYLERAFTLLCSDLNGRLISNEYVQTVLINQSQMESGQVQADSSSANQGAAFQQPEVGFTGASGNAYAALRGSSGNQFELSVEPAFEFNSELDHKFRLDRLAVAFLIFLMSLIVLSLFIVFVNFAKKPAEQQAPKQRHRRSRLVALNQSPNGVKSGEGPANGQVSLNLNPTAQTNSDYFGETNSLSSSASSCVSTSASSSEANSENEDEEFGLKESLVIATGGRKNCCQVSCLQPAARSQREQNQTLLTWDEAGEEDSEPEEEGPPQIVVNPMLHNRPLVRRRSSPVKQFLIEQKPDWSGAIRRPAQTRLAYCYPNLEDEAPVEEALGCQEELPGELLPVDEDGSESSCCGSELEFGQKVGEQTGCSGFIGQRNADDELEEEDGFSSSSSADQYEIYHRHEPFGHHHHTCQRRGEEEPPAGECAFGSAHEPQRKRRYHYHLHHECVSDCLAEEN